MTIIQRLLERKYLVGAIGWTIVISILSLASLSNLPSIPSIRFKDKIIHFMFYFVFVFLWSKALELKKNKIVALVFVAVVYGIVIEVCQSVFTTTREADVYDALANSCGAFLAFLFLRIKNNL